MAAIKEELELKIVSLKMQKYKTGEKMTQEDILKMLDELEDMNVDMIDGTISGEYKDYEYEIDEENRVIVGEQQKGERPVGIVVLKTKDEVALEVKLQVIGQIEGDNTIVSIEALDKEKVKKVDDATNGDTSQMFKVTENGKFAFKIKASNRKKCKSNK